jgi:hypothetical protein
MLSLPLVAMRPRTGAASACAEDKAGFAALALRISLTISAMLIGIAVALPGTHLPSFLVFAILIVGGLGYCWAPGRRRVETAATATIGAVSAIDRSSRSDPQEEMLPELTDDDDRPVAESEWDDGLLPAGVTQRLVRATDEAGKEMIYGTIRCHFAVGQRQQNVHLAFCPPMAAVGNLTVDQLDGPEIRIKRNVLETYGAGLEIKLTRPSTEPTNVQIQFFAFEQAHDGQGW